ncbi:hypothetical protein BLNAU_24298 [Blattamonas nauphoetae]|uniref:HAT C-terminal dimerisation domain-containing protein n=1 Tax=Blattamonas nauphoetae TaxID=2049346 RepID=A0ABQ9WMU7_9EUKA|nr:hypothetical protein BLNAU_24298 [Blattamonas nauphoetae]
MSNPENLLRIASILLLLNRTTETNTLLQRTVLSLADSKTVIDSLRVELGTLTTDIVRTELEQTMTSLQINNFEPYLLVVVDECLRMAASLRERLMVRFLQPDESSDLNFLSHQFMLGPHSPDSDFPIISLASRFSCFIEDDLKPEIIDHWHHMKSLYRLNFSAVEKSPGAILDLLMTDMVFKSDTAMFPILRILKTISTTTVDTEREFSTLHFTKRKDRTNLTTFHLQILTRIYHNSPRMLTLPDIESILEKKAENRIEKKKRTRPLETRHKRKERLVIPDVSSDESSS